MVNDWETIYKNVESSYMREVILEFLHEIFCEFSRFIA